MTATAAELTRRRSLRREGTFILDLPAEPAPLAPLPTPEPLLVPRRPGIVHDLHEHQLLSSADVLEVQRRVWDMRDGWRTLAAASNVHTLGYASYLDATSDQTR